MYIKQSVRRAAGNPGIGLQPRDELVLIDVDDIAHFPSPNDRGVVIEDNIVLRPGCYAYSIYMTQGTVELTSAAEGDTDKIGFTPSIKFSHPGNETEVREFKANSVNRKFIVIVRYCSGKPSDLIGSPCNPCKLTPSYTGNNEGNANEMTFAQISKGDDIKIYTGTVTLEEPVAEVDIEATTIQYVADGQYQLSNINKSYSQIDGGQHGALITILGAGDGQAAVTQGDIGNVMLVGGKKFIANEGSQLTLKAFVTDANGSVTWIEQSRHQVN